MYLYYSVLYLTLVILIVNVNKDVRWSPEHTEKTTNVNDPDKLIYAIGE